MTGDPKSHAAAVALFMSVLDVSRAEATSLADEGHTSLEEIAFVPLDELLHANRIDRSRLLEVRARARKCLAAGGQK
jgi:hypothetical protein